MMGTGEVRALQLGTRESVGLRAVEVWNADDERLAGPFSGVVPGSSILKADRQALSKFLSPMTDDEMQAMSALDWLERGIDLPDSVKAYFWGMLERATDAVLPEAEKSLLRGSADVRLYRDVMNLHFTKVRSDRAT